MKKGVFAVVSILIAMVLFVLLYRGIEGEQTVKINYVDYVVAANKINIGDRITEKDVTIKKIAEGGLPEGVYFKQKQDLINKVAKAVIYKDELITVSSIYKKDAYIKNVDAGTREIRLLTNLLASSGATKGDLVDVVYVGKTGVTDKEVGKLVFSKIQIESVLNENGIDIESIVPDEYNYTTISPRFVTIQVDIDTAVKIDTLQGNEDTVVFKLVKYVSSSEASDGEKEIFDKKSIIYDTIFEPSPDTPTLQIPGITPVLPATTPGASEGEPEKTAEGDAQ